MPPQQNSYTPPPPAPNQTPYDFFLNPTPPQRKSLFGGSPKRRLVLFGVAFLALLIILIGGLALLRGSNDAAPSLITVAQDQSQMARISEDAEAHASSQVARNLASTTTVSLQSAQADLVSYLQKNGRTISNKELAKQRNANVDQTLQSAIAASNFDAVYIETMQTLLAAYKKDLQTAFDQSGPKAQELLRKQYKGAELLESQAKAAAL